VPSPLRPLNLNNDTFRNHWWPFPNLLKLP
jgi:hypothetical protein